MHNEDELYSGYDGNNPLAGTASSAMFQSYSNMEPGSLAVPGTASTRSAVPGTAMRVGTAAGGDATGARPMTSNRGAGFSSAPKKFDPMSQSRTSVASNVSLAKKAESSPEEQARDLEKRVHELLEESAAMLAAGNNSAAMEKAGEARKKERALCRFRESNALSDQINVDLTFAVDFNLAQTYHQNRLYQEALDAYTAIIKNKQLPQSGRLRVNMGNIYFEQRKYSNAIKMYRMALDQLPATSKEVRFKIMRNIGTAFVRMGQYQDALQAFETVMEQVPDHQTAYNLVICCYALGDKERMKESFADLVKLPGWNGMEAGGDVEEEAEEEEEDIADVVRVDGLREELQRRQSHIRKCILTSAQLIAEKIDKSGFALGFTWCAEQLRAAGLHQLANEVDLAKASRHLESQEFAAAVIVFKEFERKEKRLKARAATNLACLYLLEGDLQSAERYSDLAIETDRYNARAFVNKGSVVAAKGDLPGAVQLLQEAVAIEPYCVEAVYNTGLMNMRAGNLEQALGTFRKLHNMVPDNMEVIFQIGCCYEALGEYKLAVKWLEMLSSLVPTDPGVLAKLGALHARYEDDAKALHYYLEAHRVLPVNMDVISWLGAFHVKNEVYEKAIPYFDLASKIQPQEVKWSLMVASCYRRIGAIPQALLKYKEIHTTNPDNIECLRYLVHLCTDLGRRDDAQEFLTRLRRVERSQAAEAQATQAQQQPPQDYHVSAASVVQPEVVSEPAYQMAPVNGRKVVMKASKIDDDEWGNEELGNDLLPM